MGSEPVASLHDYVVVVRRHARLAATVLVVGLVISMIAATVIGGRRTRYAASAEVLLASPSTRQSSGGVNSDVQLNTERALVKSTVVADRAATTLHRDDARKLAQGLKVSLRDETQVLEVTATSSNARRAEAVASAFAEAYLDVRGAQLASARSDRVAAIQRQISAVEDDLRRATADLAAATPRSSSDGSSTTGDVAARADAQARQQLAIAGITTFNQQLADATATDVDPGRVVSRPEAEPVGRTGTTPVVAVLGILLSLVGAVAAALVWDRLDWRVRNGTDLEAFSGVPTLGEIPRHGRTSLVVAVEPSGPPADAYRRLRSNLRFLVAARPGASVVLVTSANEGEGKTVVTGNLALLLVRAGLRVTVVSGDLRRPRLDDLLGIHAVDGLSSVLAGRARLDDVRRVVDGATVVPAGEPADEPADLLQSTRMRDVLDELRADADIVLVDSPPALVVADALAIAQHADAVIAVADARSTGRDDVVALRHELDRAGAHLLGFVLTKVRPRRRVSSYYSSGYHQRERHAGGRGAMRVEGRTTADVELAVGAATPDVPAAVEPPTPPAPPPPTDRREAGGATTSVPAPAPTSEWGFGDWVAATVPSDG